MNELTETHPDPAHLSTEVVPFTNPSLMGWPSAMPIELALGESNIAEICAEYGISREQMEVLIHNPHFQKAFKDAQELLQKEGYRFRVKAQMQAEALLDTSWRLIHNQYTPAAVKAKLIETTIRAAGLEPKESDRAPQQNLQINISL